MSCTRRPRVSAVVAALPTALALLLAVASPAAVGDAHAATAVAALAAAPHAGRSLVSVIVKLEDEPVATYRGGVAGLAATSPSVTGAARLDAAVSAVTAYRQHLAGRFATFAGRVARVIPQSRVLHRYDVILGGVALQLPADRVSTLRTLPGVRAVYADERRSLLTSRSVGVIGAKSIWGGADSAGEAGDGVIVGVIDSGVWPEHPSFADPDPSGRPYVVPPGTRDCRFDGGANPGAPFACNGKLIGAYRFLDAYDACSGCPHPAEDFSSARDSNGHGTHTASTAIGNRGVAAAIDGVAYGMVSGVAPRAQLIAYKACGPEDGGCFASDSVAAIQQAILDGVDVINFSIGGGSDPYLDPVELAFHDAYAAGVFVAAAAGNAGPDPGTVEHLGPWVTTVAATTTQQAFGSTLTLVAGDGARLKLDGATISAGLGTTTPVVVAADLGDPLCLDDTADAAFAGKLVVCKRGGGTRLAKSFAVAQRGALGMLLYNDPADASQRGLSTDDHVIPTLHLEFDDGLALLAFVGAHTGVSGSFPHAAPVRAQGDVVAAFSSRGGPSTRLGVLKPDVAAPGVQILAGDTPEHADPTFANGQLFQVAEGTSMSSPHVAGAAALLKGLRPAWSPGQIKSALMTSAITRQVVEEDGVTPADAFSVGAGRIQLRRALAAGLTFDVPAQDYLDHEGDLWNVNQASVFLPAEASDQVMVTRRPHSELDVASTWQIAVRAPADLHIMAPPRLTIGAGGVTTFPIAIDKTAVPPEQIRDATIELSRLGSVVRLPVTVVGRRLPPDLTVSGVSASSSVTNGGFISVASTIQNVGQGNADPFLVGFYLSTDATYSPDDVLFAICGFPHGLAAGASATCDGNLRFSLVPPVASGTYRVIVFADNTRDVSESDESNNIATVAAPLLVQ